MADRLTREEARELLGAYALGAVDPDERAEIERHLLDDPEARAELHRLQRGVAWLDRAGERPDPRVWAAIEGELHGSPEARVIPIASRRARVGRGLVAVAAVLVPVLIVAAGVSVALDDGAEVSERALAAMARGATDVRGARELGLTDDSGDVVARAVVLDDGFGVVASTSLAAPGRGRTYQLWAVRGDRARSLGLMEGTTTFRLPDGTATVAVTEEPAGGSKRPTGPVIAAADLAIA